MHTRLTITQGMWRLLVAAIVALALVVTPGATSASASETTTCVVTNTESGRTYTRLQAAVDAAKPGAHLVVKGKCSGGTVIDKGLAIVGKKTKNMGRSVLDGDGRFRVVTTKRGRHVSIRGLDIQDGQSRGSWSSAGGIANRGSLTLRQVTIRRCGELGVHNQGTLRLNQGSVIRGNHTGVENEGTLVLNGSSHISRNRHYYGSGGVSNLGTLVLNGTSRIDHNTGGVRSEAGTVTLNDSSSVRDNTEPARICSPSGMYCASRWGGGVEMLGGALELNDASTIQGNASGFGGGVSLMSRTSPPSVTMNDSSSISGNSAAYRGGGLYAYGDSALIGVNCAPQTYANVYGNTPDDCYFEP